MAEPIGDTPILEGKDAEYFLNSLGKPLTKKDKKLIQEINSQRHVPL